MIEIAMYKTYIKDVGKKLPFFLLKIRRNEFFRYAFQRK